MSTIAQIKVQIANKASQILAKPVEFPVLNLTRGKIKDDAGVETDSEWLSHWDNDNRVKITMHEEVRDAALDPNTRDLLALKDVAVVAEHVDAASGKTVKQYLQFIVITPRIETSL